MNVRREAARLGGRLGRVGLCLALGGSIAAGHATAGTRPEKPDRLAVGYEIFNREWVPNDTRGHGGDGLGPVYNDTSCVACHNSGGSGGAGPTSKNIDILTASRNIGGMIVSMTSAPAGQNTPTAPAVATIASPSSILEKLTEVHAGFRTSRNVVLHKFGTDPNYDAWRSRVLGAGVSGLSAVTVGSSTIFETKIELTAGQVSVDTPTMPPPSPNQLSATRPLDREMQRAIRKSINGEPLALRGSGVDESSDAPTLMRIQQIQAIVRATNANLLSSTLQIGEFVVRRSQRNPTALFGLGLIDAIPDDAIEAVAKRQGIESPETQGRISRVKDGRIGRLGWKGQIASVEDFVLNACAVELGLEVPGHQQSMIPQAPKYQAPGHDLKAEECSALVAYVNSLPKPGERRAVDADERKMHDAGRVTFAAIGCAGCHSPRLGDVQGIYSDLLLHDMGQELTDDGVYDDSGSDDGPLEPESPPDLVFSKQTGRAQAQTPKGATRREWRTPPLWGFRDSGPYLHDGRAQTLEQAVALHGGQGAGSARKFFALSPRERLQVEALLKSLVAPESSQVASR